MNHRQIDISLPVISISDAQSINLQMHHSNYFFLSKKMILVLMKNSPPEMKIFPENYIFFLRIWFYFDFTPNFTSSSLLLYGELLFDVPKFCRNIRVFHLLSRPSNIPVNSRNLIGLLLLGISFIKLSKLINKHNNQKQTLRKNIAK